MMTTSKTPNWRKTWPSTTSTTLAAVALLGRNNGTNLVKQSVATRMTVFCILLRRKAQWTKRINPRLFTPLRDLLCRHILQLLTYFSISCELSRRNRYFWVQNHAKHQTKFPRISFWNHSVSKQLNCGSESILIHGTSNQRHSIDNTRRWGESNCILFNIHSFKLNYHFRSHAMHFAYILYVRIMIAHTYGAANWDGEQCERDSTVAERYCCTPAENCYSISLSPFSASSRHKVHTEDNSFCIPIHFALLPQNRCIVALLQCDIILD